VDIPGAFMQVDIDELIHVKLDGELVDLLVRLLLSPIRKVDSFLQNNAAACNVPYRALSSSV